jgi:hypothetical protein
MPQQIYRASLPSEPVPQQPYQAKVPYEAQLPSDQEPAQGWGGAVLSTIAPALEFISRPQYASAKFADSLADPSKSIFDAMLAGFQEFVSPKDKLSYSDVIRKRAPEFAKMYPKATSVLGFMGDVAFDPTTYLGIGFARQGLTVGRKVLTEFGKESLYRFEREIAQQEVLTTVKKKIKTEVINAERKGITAVPSTFTKTEARQKFGEVSKSFLDEFDELSKDPELLKKLQNGTIARSRMKDLALDELNSAGARAKFSKTGLVQLKRQKPVESVIRKLAPEEIRETAGQRINRLANLDPAIAEKYFKPRQLTLLVGLPFGKQKEVLKLMGLDYLDGKIDALVKFRDMIVGKKIPVISGGLNIATKVGRTLRDAFVRPNEEPFKDAITALEKAKNFNVGETQRELVKLFDEVDAAGREKISKLGIAIDDESREAEATIGRNLTQSEADRIYNDNISKVTLAPREMAAFAGLTQAYKTAMELEMEADLLKTPLLNYYPRYYKALADPGEMSVLFKTKKGLSTSLSSSKKREFLTLQEAEANGFVPELDAAKIYAARVISSRRALSVKQFEDSLNSIYNLPLGTKIGSKQFNKVVPGRIKDDIRTLGESVYPSGMNETVNNFLYGYDRLMGYFRQGATILKPAFAVKQLISNTMQMAFGTNASAFKSLDARSFLDASMMLMDYYRGKPIQGLPGVFTSILNKHSLTGEGGVDAILAGRTALERLVREDDIQSFAKAIEIIQPSGMRYSGVDVVRLGREHGMVVNFDASGEQLFKQVEELLSYDPKNKVTLSKELFKYWKMSSTFETYSRMSGFIQGLRMGYSPKQAAKVVQDNLFDYLHGLTKVEKSFVRRVMPFYSFQRFAIPQVLRTLVRQPGNATTTNKIMNVMEKLIVPDAEKMTESEREVFGDTLLIEQPRLYTGFDRDGKATFNVFNNFSPLDALSLMVYDNKTDQLDLKRTVQRTFLAALAPYIKVPLEMAIGQNFFTGKAIEQGGRIGQMSYITNNTPQLVKDLIGWEDRRNDRTGEVKTYINPYFAHVSMSAFPALREYIKPLDAETSVLDRALQMFVGSVKVKTDLASQKEWQDITSHGKAQEIKSSIRKSMLIGSENQYEKNLREYQEFIRMMEESSKKKEAAPIRGAGLGSQQNSPEPATFQEQR